MRNDDDMESREPSGRAELQDAWTHMTRLAALHLSNDRFEHRIGKPLREQHPLRARAAVAPLAPPASAELAQAIAEIETASETLRRSEPALEHRVHTLLARREPHGYRSVWLMVALIWLSSSLVVGSATAAIMYLLR